MVGIIIGGGIITVQNEKETIEDHVDRHIKLQKPRRKPKTNLEYDYFAKPKRKNGKRRN